MDLRNRILDAAPGIHVAEVVHPARTDRLPPAVKAAFAGMTIQWEANRSWGKSFHIGDKTVLLGHRQGDHLTTYPHLYGITEAQAEEMLRVQIEGTLLHELGHAMLDGVLDANPGEYKRVYQEIAMAALADGAVSTYRGHEIGGKRLQPLSSHDKLHEMFAEAFRYWCHQDAELKRAFPNWHATVDRVVRSYR